MRDALCGALNMVMRNTFVSALLLGGVALCVTGRAQEARMGTQPTFRAEVSLVEVVAVVTGEDGRSLGDLRAL